MVLELDDGSELQVNEVLFATGKAPHTERYDRRSSRCPAALFTDPEVAKVGLTREKAVQAGYCVRTVDVEIGDLVVGAAFYADGYAGRARIVVDADQSYLLGAALTGPGAAEPLHAATIAVACQVPIDRLWHAAPCFPALNELWLKLLEAYRDSLS